MCEGRRPFAGMYWAKVLIISFANARNVPPLGSAHACCPFGAADMAEHKVPEGTNFVLRIVEDPCGWNGTKHVQLWAADHWWTSHIQKDWQRAVLRSGVVSDWSGPRIQIIIGDAKTLVRDDSRPPVEKQFLSGSVLPWRRDIKTPVTLRWPKYAYPLV